LDEPIVIIGGGIIGASVAYNLASLHSLKNIVVLEKSRLGSGSTSASLGGFRHQFSNETAIRLTVESVKFLDSFQSMFGYDPLVRRDGYCFIASNENSLRGLKENLELANHLGIDVELLNSADLKRRFPFYSFEGIVGGTFCGADGHASTLAVLQGFVSRAKSLGVRFYESTEVQDILIDKGSVRAVLAPNLEIETSKLLIAAGAYSGIVGKLAGVDIPIKPYPRKILVTAPFSDSIPNEIPLIIDVDSTLAIGREGKGVILADNGPVNSSFELSFSQEYDERVISKATARVPSLSSASIAYSNSGLYELTPDSNPIVSEIGCITGLYCCAGFAGHGFMHAPAIGRVMAEFMMDDKTHLDVTAYRYERFNAEKAHDPEKLII
jgi:sarcosine oxidase, subunit beta